MKNKTPFGPDRPDIAGGGSVIPFPARGGGTTGPSTQRSTVDMLRDLFSPSKGLLGEGTGAEVVPLSPARTAKEMAAKEEAARAALPTQAPTYGAPPNEIADLRARIWESIANKQMPKVMPLDVIETMKGKLGNLGFDRPGQAVGALREDLKTMSPKELKQKWDIQPGDEMAFQKILNYLKTPLAGAGAAALAPGGETDAQAGAGPLKDAMGPGVPYSPSVSMGIGDGMRQAEAISRDVPRAGMAQGNPFSSGIPDALSNTRDIDVSRGRMVDPYRMSPRDLQQYLKENEK